MRDVYIWFSILYFIAGGFHLYQQHIIIKELKNIKLEVIKKR
jgi:hypothetical protein